MRGFFVFAFLGCLTLPILGQHSDSLRIIVNGPSSQELRDLSRFQEIGYVKVDLIGRNIANNYFILTSKEYRNNSLIKADTVVDTRIYRLKNESDTVRIRFTTRKFFSDSVKIQFGFPRSVLSKNIRQHQVICTK